MSAPTVKLVVRRVSASAEVRSVVSAGVSTRPVVVMAVPAARGPIGPRGERGPAGELGENVILDGGNF